MTQDNKLNIDTLIEALEAEKYGFDMSTWIDSTEDHPCGTTACIGGTADMLMPYAAGAVASPEVFQWITKGIRVKHMARDHHLFEPMIGGACWKSTYPESPLYVSRARAIAVLKHLRDTGEIDWDRFDNEGKETL